MATTAASAPSTAHAPLQIASRISLLRAGGAVERALDVERDQLFLWAPVMLGTGIALWFVLPGPSAWRAALALLGGVALVALAVARGARLPRVLAIAAALTALGLALVWWRAERLATPVLARVAIVDLRAVVEQVQPLPARALVRLRLAPLANFDTAYSGPAGTGGQTGARAVLPLHVRVNLAMHDVPAGLATGAVIQLRARLEPPPGAGVPGGYDYARVAWFDQIGATGRGFGPVEIVAPAPAGWQRDSAARLRGQLSRHIQAAVPGGAGAIAAALATGDQGAMPPADAEAMRRAGLAHLLSVSGLHITAVVGGVMFLVLRVLALSPWLALRWRLPVVAAGAGAAAAIGYTLLTGAEVPTVRSCVAALMVLAAMALGRQAVTLRLVAFGALVVLFLWPEALVGASFQLSFAAVATIIALNDHPRVRALVAVADRPWPQRIAWHMVSLLLTGLVVEAALAPIALFHFHKAGLYGAFANIVAIPLTTFVIMPAEALALAFDLVGGGALFWWITGSVLNGLLWIAHQTAQAPGAVALLPSMPVGAFGLMVGGAVWLVLWRAGWRWWGAGPFALGLVWSIATPPPDILVTGDGRHVAVRTPQGKIALLRDRTGDYVQAMLAENGGVDGPLLFLSDLPQARCSADACIVERDIGKRRWRVLAMRSAYHLPIAALINACARADIVVAERRLPRACAPRWLKLDAPMLRQTGGISINLASQHVATVRKAADKHPWRGSPPPVAGTGRLP